VRDWSVQLPPNPRMAEGSFAPIPDRNIESRPQDPHWEKLVRKMWLFNRAKSQGRQLAVALSGIFG